MNAIFRRFKSIVKGTRLNPQCSVPKDGDELGKCETGRKDCGVNDCYVTSTPCPQNAIDIFKGEWTSQFPPPFDGLSAGGTGPFFEDVRVRWFLSEIGGVSGKTVLELGPLEGGHTYMLERAGAKSVVAVEANTRAYLKCLISKEILEMTKTRFLCGDFLEYLRDPACPQFEVCEACGVLYHMRNPAELIALVASHCTSHILLWTHYYDAALIAARGLTCKFTTSVMAEHLGFRHTLYRHEYGTALGWAGFCGGNAPYTHWMSRDDIYRCLECFGFGGFRVNFDQPDHPNGPAFALVASRR